MVRLGKPDKQSEVEQWLLDFEEDLENQELAPKTVYNYKQRLVPFRRWCRREGITEMDEITPRLLRAFFTHRKRIDECADTTRQLEQVTLNKWLKWVMEEDEELFAKNPMDRVPKVRPKKKLTPFTDLAGVNSLLGTCSGTRFTDIRDRAIIKLFRDTGMRARELTEARLDDIDLAEKIYHIQHGKGDKYRVVPFSSDTADSIKEYLEARSEQTHANLPWAWITYIGKLEYHACYMMFMRRCARAGIPPVNPHELRHLLADTWKRNGGSDDSLMTLMGWDTRIMLELYAAARKEERALEEARRMFK